MRHLIHTLASCHPRFSPAELTATVVAACIVTHRHVMTCYNTLAGGPQPLCGELQKAVCSAGGGVAAAAHLGQQWEATAERVPGEHSA
jgi:hypothetical protein